MMARSALLGMLLVVITSLPRHSVGALAGSESGSIKTTREAKSPGAAGLDSFHRGLVSEVGPRENLIALDETTHSGGRTGSRTHDEMAETSGRPGAPRLGRNFEVLAGLSYVASKPVTPVAEASRDSDVVAAKISDSATRKLQSACVPGTTASYADETLAFRFRSENLATDENGLRWNAVVPPGLAFTMVRPPDPVGDSTGGWYSEGDMADPSTSTPPGVPDGVHFESGGDAGYNQMMVSNQKVAVGVANTFFAVVTPASTAQMFDGLLSFRPSNAPGVFGWLMATDGCPNAGAGEANEHAVGCMFVDDWSPSGFFGPAFQGDVTQIAIYRSRLRHNSLGVLAPVVDMAILEATGDTLPVWTSTLFNEGLEEYNKQGGLAEDFDLDFRDPDEDGLKAFAAGYMQLGQWTLHWAEYFQFRGVVHALELHSSTLSNDYVHDVVGTLRSWLNTSIPLPSPCEECAAGTADYDHDASTSCEHCRLGRFSASVGASTCASTCPIGSTTIEVGSTSVDDCVACSAGSFGEIIDSTAVCSLCVQGRSSRTVAADSDEACAVCPTGTSSKPGWQECLPSGCLDTWAENYVADANLDEGGCQYLCENLWQNIGGGSSEGGCLIFENDAWQRYAPNGTKLPGGPIFGVDAESMLEQESQLIGETWVIQGRSLPGSTDDDPDYVEYAADKSETAVDVDATLILRYVSFLGHTEGALNGATFGSSGSVTMDHLLVESNVMMGARPLGFIGAFRISHLTCRDNLAGFGGGCIEMYEGTTSSTESILSHSTISNNECGLRHEQGGGGVSMFAYTYLTISFTAFTGNRARQGGAIETNPSTRLNLRHCMFAENEAYIVGGAITSELATITIISTQFVSNFASGTGAALHIDQPVWVKIVDTTFNPYMDGALVVFIGGRLAGCAEHPCDPGYSCGYSRYSLTCTPCSSITHSTDGLQCVACGAGTQPNVNGTACVPCAGNMFSTSGVCEFCFGDSNADHTACTECPLNQVSNADATGCVCTFGRYNRTQLGIITCVNNDFIADAFDVEPIYAIPRDQVLNGLQCIECPLCVDCSKKDVRLLPGFQQSKLALAQTPSSLVNKSFMRCRPETAHMDGLGNDGTGFDAIESLCTAGGVLGRSLPVAASCRPGHTGTLCHRCQDGYGLAGEDECKPCADTMKLESILQLVGVMLLIGFIGCLVLLGVSFAIGEVYETVTVDVAGMSAHSNPLHDEDSPTSENKKGTMLKDTNRPSSVDFPKPQDQNRFSRFDTVTDHALTLSRDHTHAQGRRVSIAVIMKTSKRLLLSGTALAIQPMKLLVSYVQIVGHVGVVLHFQFPPVWAAVLASFKPLVANIRGVVALECAGLADFHSTWLVEVIAIPLTLLAFLGGFYIYRRQIQGPLVALNKLFSEAFFLLFLIYPFVSNKLFSVLNCRKLSEKETVLAQDYDVDCNDPRHSTFQTGSIILICLFSLGVPIGLLVALRLDHISKTERFKTPAWEWIQRRVMVQLGHSKRRDVRHCIIDLSLGTTYGSLVSAYKPAFFWWEPIDLLRKLTLVGMLAVVERGSVAQVWAGLMTSFIFFALHVKSWPFRHQQENILKACTEAHVFVVLLFVLTMKTDLHGEILVPGDYDLITFYLFLLMVPGAAIACVTHKWATVMRAKVVDDKGTGTQRLKAAFQRYLKALDTAADRTLLSAYFTKLEDEINGSFHVFISYRVAPEKEFAKALFDALSGCTVESTGQKLRIYLDQVCLEDGARWDSGFMQGLGNSWIVVPVLSTEGLNPMKKLNSVDGEDGGQTDNVLLEWIAALELFERNQVKAIIPVIVPSGKSDADFDWGLPKELSAEEHMPTTAAAKKHLREHPSSDSIISDLDLLEGAAKIVSSVTNDADTQEQVTVAGVVNAVLRFQGVKMSDRTSMEQATDRITAKVSAILQAGDSALTEEAEAGTVMQDGGRSTIQMME